MRTLEKSIRSDLRGRRVPSSAVFVERQLLSVLIPHYYVQQQTFDEISAHDMMKHEICHLTKAVYKAQMFFDSPANSEEKARRIIISELVPDMVIYGLECALKYGIDWWTPLLEGNPAPRRKLLGFLAKKHSLHVSSELEVLDHVRSMISKSVSRLGHFCDKGDHRQDSKVNLETEVVLPFFKVALYLASFYALDLDEVFTTRLVFVQNNYVGQPNFR